MSETMEADDVTVPDDIGDIHLYRVLKPFDGDGARRHTGEVVDATTWPLTQQLVSQRYMVPFHGKPISARDRLWSSGSALKSFISGR